MVPAADGHLLQWWLQNDLRPHAAAGGPAHHIELPHANARAITVQGRTIWSGRWALAVAAAAARCNEAWERAHTAQRVLRRTAASLEPRLAAASAQQQPGTAAEQHTHGLLRACTCVPPAILLGAGAPHTLASKQLGCGLNWHAWTLRRLSSSSVALARQLRVVRAYQLVQGMHECGSSERLQWAVNACCRSWCVCVQRMHVCSRVRASR